MRKIPTIVICGMALAWLPGVGPSAAAAPERVTGESTLTVLAQAPANPQATTAPATLKDDPRYQRWRMTITWSLVILIAFVTAAAAIVVFSRGFRRWIGRERKAPTASEDVWAMHKIPENLPDLDEEDDANRD
ncbi:MAG: hypothetical protein H6818_17835 [Phycisphaerales bacterium]|nr:hypothetical protein [Phycisphaerales bacterium]